MRRQVQVFCIASLLCLSCMAKPRLTRSATEQNDAAVEIAVVCENGSMYAGTGVALPDSRALTAFHVIAPCPGGPLAIVAELDDTAMLMQPESIAPNADVVRLEPVDLGLAKAPLSKSRLVELGPLPEPGETVCIAAARPYHSRRCGVVEFAADRPHGIRFDAIVEPGNSGSGVYDSAGRLVGIATKLYQCHNGQICGGLATPLVSRGWVVTW